VFAPNCHPPPSPPPVKSSCVAHARRSGIQPPRVALCLFGSMRSLALPAVYESVRRNLIEAAGVSDTFVKLRLTEVAKRGIRVDRPTPPADAWRQASAALAHLGATVATIDADDPLRALDTSCWCEKDAAYHAGLLNRWEAQRWCYAQVTNREETVGCSYDAVIAARADLFWGSAIPPVDALRALCIGHRSGMCAEGPRVYLDRDHVFVIPRPLLEATLTHMLSAAEAFCAGRHNGTNTTRCVIGGGGSEGMTRLFMASKKVRCVVSSFQNVSIARTADTWTLLPRGAAADRGHLHRMLVACGSSRLPGYWSWINQQPCTANATPY